MNICVGVHGIASSFVLLESREPVALDLSRSSICISLERFRDEISQVLFKLTYNLKVCKLQSICCQWKQTLRELLFTTEISGLCKCLEWWLDG